ncbi:MAG: hypothetical protein JSV12_03480 [Candidatus Bathyarchaeota archaeon]|nr:MAG: hypothetical protein JSV12_03480 [Candidatus Bathyarchaeota archaeon]
MVEVENRGIEKLKAGLLLAVVLVVVLAVSSVWLYVTVENLQDEVEYWQDEADYWENNADYLYYVTEDLNDEIDTLTEENDDLRWEIEEVRFDFYYVKPKQKFGVYDLEDELSGLEWIKQYQAGVFDCSEMSAYLEWHLENEGWHSEIVIGDSPFGSGRHAWLLVETSEGRHMPVETTNLEVVWWSDPNFDNYWEYDRGFETIQEALDYNESEFDWWK